MATYKNSSEETFVFPSLGITVEPGESFDSDAEITTAGIEIGASSKKAKAADPAPAVDSAPITDPAPADPAGAPATAATPEGA